MPRLLLLSLAAFLVFPILFGGCAKLSPRLSEQVMMEEPPPAEMMSDEEAEEAMAEGEAADAPRSIQASGDTQTALTLMAAAEAASSRKVIKTADVTVEVNDLKQAQKRVLDLVESKAGFVQSLSVTTTSEVRKDATIVARTPSISFGGSTSRSRGSGRSRATASAART